VQDYRVEIDFIRPNDGAQLFVNRNSGEEQQVVQRLEYPTREQTPEIQLSHEPVVEREPQAKAPEVLDGRDTGNGLWIRHLSGSMLVSGRRRLARSQLSSSSQRCACAHSRTSHTRLGSPNLDHRFPRHAAITAIFEFSAELGLID